MKKIPFDFIKKEFFATRKESVLSLFWIFMAIIMLIFFRIAFYFLVAYILVVLYFKYSFYLANWSKYRLEQLRNDKIKSGVINQEIIKKSRTIEIIIYALVIFLVVFAFLVWRLKL